ncbi:isochorismatase domain-containing protein 1-like [Patiria miniata]|uniref:Isochorismatase domain-containing protein 1 n=1 Tax=Patiria miniata TaxID=46514 RepID=A0A914A3S5_PATMI|nr:isochorismatase domain-containing protein 1-like [Patiria miniata]
MAAPMRTLGNLAAESTVFFLCDMQEKFKPAIKYFSDIVEVAKRLTETSKILEIPLIVTEQYPKGLGSTVSDLDITHAVGVFPKTKFSMVLPPVEEELQKRPNLRSVVLFGIEAHVCVQQTALDLLAKGLEVHIVADACSSRSMMDRQFAYERLRQAGAIVTTSEAVIFQLLGESKHPKFKEVQALVKAVAPVSGLAPNL